MRGFVDELDHPPGPHLRSAALDLQRLEGLGSDLVLRRAHGCSRRAGSRPCLGHALEPCGDVECVTGGEPGPACAGAYEDLPGLHAQLHPDSDPERVLELGAQVRAGGAHLDRHPHRAQRVVLVDLRLPEDAYYGVADEALDRAAMPLDHLAA